GKALGNPERSPEELLKEYVAAAFEEASAPMLAFFNAMFHGLEAYSVFSRPNGPRVNVPQPFRRPSDFYCHFFPPGLVDDMSRALKRASALARSEKVKANIKLVSLEFEYVKNLAAIFHSYRAYRAAPSWGALELVERQVLARKALLKRLFPGGRQLRIPGLTSPFSGAPLAWVAPGGRNAALLGPPLNWDFETLRKHKILPGTGTRKATAMRTRHIKLDGRLDEASWAKAPVQQLAEIGLGALKNSTQFRVLYDDTNIYFGVVCQVDKFDEIDEIKPVGHDGAAWTQENVEIMIDPFGSRQRHYQFIVNPVPGSLYDARYAFITDPLHPLYGKRDSSWNGEW
ncbi:MAG TPA: hypothetical protein EYP19_10530, partial [Desulfobacterales bacterium]|nr:hypothetical protein [Desulfobacterales bacterium]